VLCTIVHRAVKTGAFGSLKFTENGAARQLTYDFPLASTVTVFLSCYLIHDIGSYWSKLHTFSTSHAVFTIQYQYKMDRLSTIVCTMLWICTANAWHNENTTQSLQILSVWTICITLIITRGHSTLTQRPRRCHIWTVQSYLPGGTNVHPIYYMLPWAHPSPQRRRHLDRFSHFCRAHNRDILTDWPTDRPCYSICNNALHLCTHYWEAA